MHELTLQDGFRVGRGRRTISVADVVRGCQGAVAHRSEGQRQRPFHVRDALWSSSRSYCLSMHRLPAEPSPVLGGTILHPFSCKVRRLRRHARLPTGIAGDVSHSKLGLWPCRSACFRNRRRSKLVSCETREGEFEVSVWQSQGQTSQTVVIL